MREAHACPAVGHPVLAPDLGRHERVEGSSGQGRVERAPEEPGEGPDGHEPGRRAGREPLHALGCQCQTIHPGHWESFISLAVDQAKRYHGNKWNKVVIPYIL